MKNDRANLAKRLKRRGLITTTRGLTTAELKKMWEEHIETKSSNKSMPRANLSRRLKRAGLIQTIRGKTTKELENMWSKYEKEQKNEKKETTAKIVKQSNNFTKVTQSLEHFTREYEEFFLEEMSWRGAWRYLNELKYFYQRLDENKINSEKDFIVRPLVLIRELPSHWWVNDERDLQPEFMIDYLKVLYQPYLK